MLPLKEWAREAALEELARVVSRFPFEDFDRDARPRLARLTVEQRAIVEEGLAGLLGRAEGRGRADRLRARLPGGAG